MKVRIFIILFLTLAVCGWQNAHAQQPEITEAAPGVLKISVGAPDQFTPYAFCNEKPMAHALAELPPGTLPFDPKNIHITITGRGVLVEVPLAAAEQLFGFGLQMGSFNQRGLRKKPIVNDNPLNDVGYTHAPEPFYVSNAGYGILINTARYTTFYCGTLARHDSAAVTMPQQHGGNSVAKLYKKEASGGTVSVDIPGAKGIDIYIFEGPNLGQTLRRYNLFSGGGALPALWGLGVKYRVKADFNQQQVTKMAAYFRSNHIPCDVFGLEPKWQTASYSCSYVWNESLFPNHDLFIDSLLKQGFHLNLWEHAFTSPKSPLYGSLSNKAGDYLVWNGLVPDFADSAARQIFGQYHDQTFVQKGISGFKMDECDNSNLATGSSNWSFPEHSQFPSGINGEQMHQLFGELYQRTIYNLYKTANRRTYLDVRSSGAFASGYPASLYSDTYDHDEYIRMTVNSGFGGLLWSPEVRESTSITDLLRRTQTAVLSAQTLFNSWYLQNPPWLQINIDKNNRNELMPNAAEIEGDIRTLLNLRMSLAPYLYNAFAQYHFKGIPPFRALVVDFPTDTNTFNISDEYLIGADLLAAPLTAKANQRRVYLPAGYWYDFNTNKRYVGGAFYTISTGLTQLPLFVREGAILPLAKPVAFIAPDTEFEITCRVYGNKATNSTIFEDDGITFNYTKGEYNAVTLLYADNKGTVSRKGSYKKVRYRVSAWDHVQ